MRIYDNQVEIPLEGQGVPCPIRLSDLRPGDEGIISCLVGNDPFQRRLMEMGFRPGSRVGVVKMAPLGNPIIYSLDGTEISLRLSEASFIMVKPIRCRMRRRFGRRRRERFLKRQ